MTTATDSQVFVHRAALCEAQDIAPGTRIWAFAHVMKGAIVGRDCNIGGYAFIESGSQIGERVTIKNHVMVWNGVRIEDDVFVGPGVIFTNDRYPRSSRMAEVVQHYDRRENWLVPTTVCRGATIGAGAVILCGITIGTCAMVGAGAVVTRDVADHLIVVGNPARAIGWACVCGVRLDDRFACDRCSRRYRRVGDTKLETRD